MTTNPNTTTEGGWQGIATAPKDGRYILAIYRAGEDGFRKHLNGRVFAVRHEGVLQGYDMGWALFPGYGGCPDDCLSHWMPLPAAPVSA